MKQHHLILGVALAALFSGCRKYEDGGTHKHAEKHLTETWTLDKVYKNNLEILDKCGGSGTEDNGFWCKQVLSFSSGGEGSYLFSSDNQENETGSFTWEFREKKEYLYISFYENRGPSGGFGDGSFKILRLGKGNFNLRVNSGDGSLYVLEFIR